MKLIRTINEERKIKRITLLEAGSAKSTKTRNFISTIVSSDGRNPFSNNALYQFGSIVLPNNDGL